MSDIDDRGLPGR